MTPSINRLFDEVHHIPQVPEIVRTLINQLNQPHAEMLDIARNVEKEQVIALKVLRLVNSAHFGLSRKVSSISEATMLIGLTQLKTLVVASGIVGSVPDMPNFDIKQFWKNTFLCAAYAKWFAEKAGLGLEAEVAYTAGLLSGMGNILLQLVAPKEANEIDQRVKAGRFRPDIERNKLGYTSRAVCAELCRRWKLGPELITAIEQSAEPLAAANPNKLACAVFLGDYLSLCRNQDKSAEDIIAGFPVEIAAALGFDAEFATKNMEEILGIKSNLEGLSN